ncbi:MAG TPA: D-alanine--D-alanine ligase, partial [Candidatus Kapabacteria bacterium]|nr:D-alanine--D-alanine ligase [Candidatus Kapabacteria bacterium]
IDFSTMPEGLHKIVSYEAKWIEDSPAYISTKPRCPASLDEKDAEYVRDVALRAYKAMECRDYARVDIRLKDHTPYVLEVNPNPDLSADAGFMRSTGVFGLNYNQTIRKILTLAAERCVPKP